jgi:hypothetical protein
MKRVQYLVELTHQVFGVRSPPGEANRRAALHKVCEVQWIACQDDYRDEFRGGGRLQRRQHGQRISTRGLPIDAGQANVQHDGVRLVSLDDALNARLAIWSYINQEAMQQQAQLVHLREDTVVFHQKDAVCSTAVDRRNN